MGVSAGRRGLGAEGSEPIAASRRLGGHTPTQPFPIEGEGFGGPPRLQSPGGGRPKAGLGRPGQARSGGRRADKRGQGMDNLPQKLFFFCS